MNELPTLSVVIPALNEERGIATIIERVLSIQPALAVVGIGGLELIVVDDGSKDHTPEIIARYKNVRLVRHPVNRGYGAALKTGFQAASGQFLAFLDADGTYPPEDFPILCTAALEGADLVVGSRRSGAKSEMPAVRQLGNFLWSNLVSMIGNQRVQDPASGMRVIRREALEKLYPLPDGLNFTPVMSTRAVHEGLKMVEVPIIYKERIGRSKLRVVRDGVKFLNTILWTSLNYNPVRILGGIGIAFGILALILVAGLVGLRLSGITSLNNWEIFGIYSAVVCAFASVDLFALGIAFNYLVSIFHKRPVRQGMFGKPVFAIPLDRQFWWIGSVAMLTGLVLGIVSLLAMGGGGMERLWLYLQASTVLLLIGLQLVIFWVIFRVLEELSQREAQVQQDLGNPSNNG